jgi:hypothetical protein
VSTKSYDIKLKKGKGLMLEESDWVADDKNQITDVIAWIQKIHDAEETKLGELIQPKTTKNLVAWLNANAFKNPIRYKLWF